ncbi:MAG: hypothetical protein HY846_08690 [Nitrosomonadales bacterium]|nr:hypothetical protein [Nitrosomonadales bacterium]
MNMIVLPLAAALLLSSPLAAAETADAKDLTYCLDLPSDREIAKCAGEIKPGSKGEPYTQEQVEKILAGEKTGIPQPKTVPEKPAGSAGTP